MRDRKQFEKFKTEESTEKRQSLFRRWVIESFLLHGVTSIVCLYLLGHLSTLVEMPDFLKELSTGLHEFINREEGGFLSNFFYGIAMTIIPFGLFGFTLISLIRTYQQHKLTVDDAKEEDSRGVSYLIPRNKSERFWTALLSVNAGFSEELFFRLLAPLLIWIITGSAWVAIIAATIWFGMAHFYQGMIGILVTAYVGALLMFVYLYSGSIWLAIAVHAMIDLNDLAIGPAFKEWLEKREQKLMKPGPRQPEFDDYVDHPRYGKYPRVTGQNPLNDFARGINLHWLSQPNSLIPNTAIKANPSRQIDAMFPISHYYDLKKTCWDCDRDFIFFACEQKHWYEELQFSINADCIRCVECRKEKQFFANRKKQYELLLKSDNRSDTDTLTLVDCGLTLIETSEFGPRVIETINRLLKSIPEDSPHRNGETYVELVERAKRMTKARD